MCIKLVIILAEPTFAISLFVTHPANVTTGLILSIWFNLIDLVAISAKSRDEGIGIANGVLELSISGLYKKVEAFRDGGRVSVGLDRSRYIYFTIGNPR